MDRKKQRTKSHLKIIKTEPEKKDPCGLKPQSETAKTMTDFCDQLQKQIDQIMRM